MMKSLIHEIFTDFKNDGWQWRWLLPIGLFVIFFIYNYGFERIFGIMGHPGWQKSLWIGGLGMLLWTIAMPLSGLRTDSPARRKTFLFFIFVVICVGFVLGSGLNNKWSAIWEKPQERLFISSLLYRLRFLQLIIPFFLISILFIPSMSKAGIRILGAGDRKKSYLKWLLIIIPLVIFALCFSDFQKVYPRIKPWNMQSVFGMSKFGAWLVSELAYALDFVFVEWFFRGILVIVAGKFWGRKVIIASAILYAFLHFGKPALETLSSLLGGYLLGHIAFETKSIRWCIVFHLGMALFMEFSALSFHYLF